MPLSQNAFKNAIQQLKKEEGYKKYPYLDSKGIETIGFGLNLKSRGISMQEAELPLRNDIQFHYDYLNNQLNFFKNLNEPRKVALVDMAFNMGDGGLLGFKKMLHYLSTGDFLGAGNEMRNSLWYKEIQISRADRLINMIVTGNWPTDIG